jgi:hypothetical protein
MRSSSDECGCITTGVMLVILSAIVIGLGSTVIHTKIQMDNQLVSMTCSMTNSILASEQRGGVCHEATYEAVSCSPDRIFNQSNSIPVLLVFPPLRVSTHGNLVCYKKDDMNLPAPNAAFIQASCDIQGYFHSDIVRCYYGTYSVAGWIAGMVLGSIVWCFVCLIIVWSLFDCCMRLCCSKSPPSSSS